jgi:hypothetical protein
MTKTDSAWDTSHVAASRYVPQALPFMSAYIGKAIALRLLHPHPSDHGPCFHRLLHRPIPLPETSTLPRLRHQPTNRRSCHPTMPSLHSRPGNALHPSSPRPIPLNTFRHQRRRQGLDKFPRGNQGLFQTDRTPIRPRLTSYYQPNVPAPSALPSYTPLSSYRTIAPNACNNPLSPSLSHVRSYTRDRDLSPDSPGI